MGYTVAPMKKLAIGCGLLLILLGAAGGYFAYWVVSKGRQLYSQVERSAGEFARAADLDEQITNQAPFAPPDTGELTKAQVERFVSLQRRVRTDLGTRFDQISARFERLEAQGRSGNSPPLAEGLAALNDLAGLVVDVKKVHVAALNEHGMSLQEYRWLRDQVYAAAGVPFTSLHLAAIVEAAKSGNMAEIESVVGGGPDTPAVPVPDGNRALVAPHREQLREWAALAWLGM